MEIPDGRWDPESVILNDELMGVVESTIAAMSDKPFLMIGFRQIVRDFRP